VLVHNIPCVTLKDPNTIRFTQDSIKNTFKDGHTLTELIDDLKSGRVSADDLPAIRIFEKDGKIFSLDNRRLKAFQEAGVQIRTIPADEIANEAFKFTTTNNGTSIRVRGGGF
jgi:filamentous hemagglutinin